MSFETIEIKRTYEVEFDVHGDVYAVNGIPIKKLPIRVLDDIGQYLFEQERKQAQ